MLAENEKWVVGYEGKYSVNTEGQVISFLRAERRVMTGSVSKDHRNGASKYHMVSLSLNGTNKTWTVHRLIAEAFLPNPENKPQVNHIDGVKLNNKLENLEWVTRQENVTHAWLTGLAKKRFAPEEDITERNNRFILYGDLGGMERCTIYSKLTEEDYYRNHLPREMRYLLNTDIYLTRVEMWNKFIEIYKMIDIGMRGVDIVSITGLSNAMVSHIKLGARHSYMRIIYEKYGNDPYYLVNYTKQYDY